MMLKSWYKEILMYFSGSYFSYAELVLLMNKLPINFAEISEVDNIICSFIKMHKSWDAHGSPMQVAQKIRDIFIEENVLIGDAKLRVNIDLLKTDSR